MKKDGSTQLVKVEAFEGKVAKLVRTNGASLLAGNYSVTVKGLKEDATVTTKVEAQKATSLNISSQQLLDGTPKAKVGVELKDQYGEKLTVTGSDYTATAFNKTQNAPVAISFDPTEKSFVVNTASNADAFKLNDEITVTFVHNNTGLTATKTLKVVSGAQLNSVTLGDVQLPTGKTLLTEDLTNVKVPYTAKDQYGNDTTLDKTPGTGNVEVISTDSTVVSASDVTFTKEKDQTVINVAKFLKAGKTNIIILNKVTGETTTLALEVNEKAGVPYAVALAESAVDVPVGGSKVVALTVTDKYGNKVEPKDYVGAAFTVSSSNLGVANADIDKTAGDDTYGKLVITHAGQSQKGDKATITVTLNATGQTSKVDVTLGEAAAPFDLAVSKDSKHATSLVVGGETTVKFDTFDQYNTKLGATGSYAVKYELKDVSNEAITIKPTETGDAINAAEVVIQAKKAGSGTLVAKLVKTGGASDEVIDTVEIPFTTVANSSKIFTYEVADIAKLYKDGDGVNDTTLGENEMGDNTHAQEIKVQAKAADGSTLTVPNNSILGVTAVTDNVKVNKDNDGKWYVAGSAPSITDDATGTIRINVATDEGTKTIEKQVTISKENLQTVAVKAMDKAVANKSTAKAKTELGTETYTGSKDLSDAGIFLWEVDQFGVATDLNINDADNVTAAGFKGITFVSDDTFNKGNDVVTITDVNGDTVVEAGATYRLTVIEDGVALDLPVRVTEALADTTAPTLNSASLAADDKTVTLTLSEAVTNNLADDAALKAAVTFAADGTNFGALAAGDTVQLSGNKLTVTFANALTGANNKVAVAPNALKDAANNKNAAINTVALDAASN